MKNNFWIGLRKYGSLWLWVNGEYAAPASIYWEQNEPNNYNVDRDCALIQPNSDQNYGRTTIARNCERERRALCEKKYSPNN